MNKCIDCAHSRPVLEDMAKRICKGAPPQLVTMQQANKITLQTMWPTVLGDAEGCGLFKPKIVLDVTTGSA